MLLRVQDRILLSLAFLGDVFENLADAGGIMSFSYEQVYGFTPPKYKRHNFQAALRYTLKTGKIEKIVKEGTPYLRLTGKGKNKLVRDFPLIWFQNKKWDRIWRVLIYDIREIERGQRNKLRRKLYELGFKQFQKSVYLSCYPIEEEMADFLKSLRLEEKVRILLCRKIIGVNDRELAQKLWQLNKLNKEYKKIWEKLKGSLTKEALRNIKVKYLELLSIDPFLPKELLPSIWWREEVQQKAKRMF